MSMHDDDGKKVEEAKYRAKPQQNERYPNG